MGACIDNNEHHKVIDIWNAILKKYHPFPYIGNSMLFNRNIQNLNAQVYTIVLKACARSPALTVGKAVHTHILANNVQIDSYLGSALIHMYGRCGKFELAHKQFNPISKNCLLIQALYLTLLTEMQMYIFHLVLSF